MTQSRRKQKTKNHPKPLLTAAIITDIHYGPDTGSKLGSKAERLMVAFSTAVKKYGPAFVVDMGDRISGRNPADDRRHMQSLQSHFNLLSMPVHTLIGNHDIRHLSRQENQDITGSPATSWSMDRNNVHFVFWNPEAEKNGNGLNVTEADMDWLKKDLQGTDKNTILFSHIPFDHELKEEENQHDHIAMRFHYADSAKIRAIAEESGRVKLCMSGHVHRNHRAEINGIHYVSQQSLTQMHKKHYRVPARAWSWLELYDDKILIRLQGQVKKDYAIALS